MELDELVGLHELSGVDFDEVSIEGRGGGYDQANVMNFVLDGQTYTIIEDPDDGYRSAMREIRASDFKVTNVFPPIWVMVAWRHAGEDILDFIDTENGKCVLSAGTDHSDDYYPSFVAEFTPENMSLNDAK